MHKKKLFYTPRSYPSIPKELEKSAFGLGQSPYNRLKLFTWIASKNLKIRNESGKADGLKFSGRPTPAETDFIYTTRGLKLGIFAQLKFQVSGRAWYKFFVYKNETFLFLKKLVGKCWIKR